MHEILKRSHRHTKSSIRLSTVLPKPPRLAFRNPKTLKDKLVRSKLKPQNHLRNVGVEKCGRVNCHICAVLDLGNTFRSTTNHKIFKINFNFNCNSQNVIYLLTCRVCKIQYVGSTTTIFRLRFNRYKSNLNLYSKGRRGFQQESLIMHFFQHDHHGDYRDLSVQIIDYCEPNNPERREYFWIFNLDTESPSGLNSKTLL